MPPVDYKEVLRKERAAQEEARAKEEQLIVAKMEQSGQTIYYQMKKTYGCRIDGLSIVFDELQVRIKPPYRPEDVEGDPKSRDRMRDIVTPHCARHYLTFVGS
jgi:hypothetical protein